MSSTDATINLEYAVVIYLSPIIFYFGVIVALLTAQPYQWSFISVGPLSALRDRNTMWWISSVHYIFEVHHGYKSHYRKRNKISLEMYSRFITDTKVIIDSEMRYLCRTHALLNDSLYKSIIIVKDRNQLNKFRNMEKFNVSGIKNNFNFL